MKNIIFSFLMIVMLGGCAATGSQSGSAGIAPVNFYTVQDFKNVNKYAFSCDFSKVIATGEKARPFCVRSCPDNVSCSGLNADNYVSYFIPFNFQYSRIAAYDYAINAFRYMEKNNLTAEKKMMNTAFTSSNNALNVKTSSFAADLSFPKFIPYSFALQGSKNGYFHVFVSAKDVLLRNKIYPTLKILSLKKPENPAEQNTLSKYSVAYTVSPSAFEAVYEGDWLSYFLGIPLYKEGKFNIDSVAQYFAEVAKGASSVDFNSGSAVTASEKARPFDFADKLANPVSSYPSETMKPAINGKDQGFLNEYLPYYELDKVEIIKKSKNGDELTVQVFEKGAIDALIANTDPTAGFTFSGMKNDNDTVSVRFTHSAKAPQFLNLGVLDSINTGVRDIFGLLSSVFVSDLEISKFYDFKDIPRDCLVKTDAARILDGSGVSAYDAKTFMESFKDNSSVCDPREIIMTNVILIKDMR